MPVVVETSRKARWKRLERTGFRYRRIMKIICWYTADSPTNINRLE